MNEINFKSVTDYKTADDILQFRHRQKLRKVLAKVKGQTLKTRPIFYAGYQRAPEFKQSIEGMK